MSHRSFDPRRDAQAAVGGWLRPGEQLVWTRHSFNIGYDMPGRKQNGKPKRSFWRILSWILVVPIIVLLLRGSADDSDAAVGGERPLVFAFGRIRNCQAGSLADSHQPQLGFWVLTSQRFAFARAVPLSDNRESAEAKTVAEDADQTVSDVDNLPPEPVRLDSDWEFARGQFTHKGVISRSGEQYERLALADGSGFDFRR